MAGLTKRPLVPAFVRIAAASALASTAVACGDDDGTGGESQGSNPTDTSPEGPTISDGVTGTSAEGSAGTTNAVDTSPEGPCPPSECTLTSTGPTTSGATDTDTDTDGGTDTDTDTDASSGSSATDTTTG
jgi:hypothetical protein